MDLTGFNPFQYQGSGTRSTGTQISLRKTGMQELTAELLRVQHDEGAMKQVLQAHKNFLLEPLEEEDAVLDLDSIYSSEMTREQRYQAYREAMQERLSRARDGKALKVLTTMMDFVLSHE